MSSFDEHILGVCLDCNVPMKHYRKLTDKGYWINYNECQKCQKVVNFHISYDEGSLFVITEDRENMAPLTDFLVEQEKALKLAKNLMKKIENKTATVDEIEILRKWINDTSHRR